MSPIPPHKPQGNLKKSNGTIYGTTEVTEEGKHILYNSWKIKNFSAISVVRF